MQSYSQEHLNQLLAEVDAYFEESGDRSSYLWALTNIPLPCKSLRGGRVFGGGKSTIAVIDPFDGRKPGKFYHDYKTRRYDVGFRPMLVLDTQLVTYLRDYIKWVETGQDALGETLRRNVESFLRFAVEEEYDFNPFFYYLESVAKDAGGRFESDAAAAAIAVLKLHSMDKDEFLRRGKVVIDEGQLASYRREFGGATLEETALRRSREMSLGLKGDGFEFVANIVRAILLQTAIIHAAKGLRLVTKLGRLRDFMEESLNMVLVPEYFVAAYYFAGATGSFIPTAQPGVNVAKALTKFKGTTWDLIMLKVPSMQLMMEDEGFTNLSFICTADRAFAKIASQMVVAGVTRLPYDPDTTSDRILFRQDDLIKLVGKDVYNEIQDYTERRTFFRTAQKLYYRATGRSDHLLSQEELSDLVADLERQFIELCQRGA